MDLLHVAGVSTFGGYGDVVGAALKEGGCAYDGGGVMLVFDVEREDAFPSHVSC